MGTGGGQHVPPPTDEPEIDGILTSVTDIELPAIDSDTILELGTLSTGKYTLSPSGRLVEMVPVHVHESDNFIVEGGYVFYNLT